MSQINRRNLIRGSLTGMGLLGTMSVKASDMLRFCGLTPSQTEGPFFPEKKPSENDSDLTFVKDPNKLALGERIVLNGRVINENCEALSGYKVIIWQACESGRYNHSLDPNDSSLDPNFQYTGESNTDADGLFHFKTIIPGAYPATPTWDRPPHIHFKVLKGNKELLTSQIYFKGHELNEVDNILQATDPVERERLIIDFQADPIYGGLKSGFFEIAIKES